MNVCPGRHLSELVGFVLEGVRPCRPAARGRRKMQGTSRRKGYLQSTGLNGSRVSPGQVSQGGITGFRRAHLVGLDRGREL